MSTFSSFVTRTLVAVSIALASGVAAADEAAARRALAECESRADGCGEDELQALAALGRDAARVALERFDVAPLAARRQRAWIVRTAGDAGVLPEVLRVLADPSAHVRAELVAFLARPDLADADLASRARALAQLAAADPSSTVRAAAIRALADLDRTESWSALDANFDALPRVERVLAASELARSPHAASIVARRVTSGLDARAVHAREAADVLGVLLIGYAKNVADLRDGGTSRAERAPILVALRDRDPVLARAGTAAFDALVRRIGQLGDGARVQAVLAGFQSDGIDARVASFQAGRLALLLDGDAQAAVRAAATLASAAGDPLSDDGRMWRARAALLRATAELAGASDPHAALAESIAICEGALAERLDRATRDQRERHEAWLALRASAELTVALARVARVVPAEKAGLEGADAFAAQMLADTYPYLLAHAVRAHALELETMISRWDGDRDSGSAWDVLGAELSPHVAILENTRLAHWPSDRRLNARRMLLRALASVAPATLPGFEPWPDVPPPLGDPVADPQRRPLVRALQYAQFDALDRQRDRLETELAATLQRDPSALDFDLLQRIEEIRYTLRDFGASFANETELPLLKPIFPSPAALDLARDLTDEGRIEEARALALRMRADLEESGLSARYVGGLELAAEIEMAIGATYTQGDEPERAETELVKALERLQAIEDLLAKQGVREGGLLRVRLLRRGALVSLAVNANVKQKDPVKATAYFERAYALSQDDFMRVLLACYRARGGRTAEARTLLSGVTPSPSTHYNMACTWALLGEKELAFVFLRREFEENRDTPGALQKQREWARKDPDLEALRDDPRFLELVGP